MKKIGFITLGCKVNIYESNALKNELTNRGYEVVEAEDDCDAYIINTCSVTNMADAKSRKMIRKCVKMNPNAIICAMGCYVQTNDEALKIDGVDILVGNGNKKQIVDELERKMNEGHTTRYVNILDILDTHEYEPLGVTTFDHTRAFVKIEDGCENFCTYCIIPYARGPVRCKPADDVINELQRITGMGYKEVVLAGIHTGRYVDGDTHFSITTDVIVGFPYESDDQYLKSKDFIRKVGFSKLHVFPYSKRKGTKAVDMPQVNDTVKKNRTVDLIEYSKELEQSYALKFVGLKMDVIVEQALNSNEMVGHTSNFLQVVLDKDESLIGSQVNVIIESVDGLKAKVDIKS